MKYMSYLDLAKTKKREKRMSEIHSGFMTLWGIAGKDSFLCCNPEIHNEIGLFKNGGVGGLY